MENYYNEKILICLETIAENTTKILKLLRKRKMELEK